MSDIVGKLRNKIQAADVREICLGCLSVDSLPKKKGLEKIVLERKKISMRSAWIGQLAAELLSGGH